MPDEIQAAGAVVWRRNEVGTVEIALIHRPKYDDWSLPKGKKESSESHIACAYRETVEETGFEVRFKQYLGETSYIIEGVQKKVKYWSAKFIASVGRPNPAEVDNLVWRDVEAGVSMMTRSDDIEIVKKFLETDLDSQTLILLRHAKAIARKDWLGEDLDRPLSAIGEAQAKALISTLAPFDVKEMHSSSAVRCYDTINPMARALSLDYFFSDTLTEYVYTKNPARTLKYIDRLLENGHTTLVCGHNPILPNYLAEKVSKQGFNISMTALKPSEAWIVHHVGKEVIAVDHLPSTINADDEATA